MNLYFIKNLTCIIQCRRGQQYWQLSISIKPMKYWPATQVGFDWLIFAFALIAWSELKDIINIATTHSNECLFFFMLHHAVIVWACAKAICRLSGLAMSENMKQSISNQLKHTLCLHFYHLSVICDVMEAKCTAHDFFPFWWQSRDSHAMSLCKQHFLLGL